MRIRDLPIMLVIVLGLTACSTTAGLISPDDLYPKDLTNCSDHPAVPPKPRSDTDNANYVKTLHSAWADCHDKVSSWEERRELYVKQYEKEHYNYFERLWRTISGDTSQ